MPKLSELFVELTAKGVGAVNAALGSVQKQAAAVQAGLNAAAAAVESSLGRVTAALEGWARAGLAGSVEGDRLAFSMTQLARSIGGLFRPEIEAAGAALDKVTNFIRSLTPEQKEMIARWAEAAATGVAVALVLPRITAGLQMVVGGLRAVTGAVVGLLSGTGIGALLPLLGFAASALISFFAASEVAKGGFGKLADTVGKFLDAIGGALGPILEKLGDWLAAAWKAAAPLIEVVVDLVGRLGKVFGELFEMAAPILDELLGVFQALVPILADVVELIGDVLVGAFKLLKPVLQVAFDILKQMLAAVREVLGAIDWMLKKLGLGRTQAAEAVKELARPEERRPGERSRLTERATGFESLEQTFARIQVAALKTGGKDPNEETAENTGQANRLLELIRSGIDRLKPATV